MAKPTLTFLLLEDNAADAELISRELRKLETDFTLQRASTEEAYTLALIREKPDLILADYNLPAFDGIAALTLARKAVPDIPFIIISGFIGEELAVEIVKHGATDYVLKDRLTRILPAVTRALQEREDREQRRKAEQQLRESERLYRLLFEDNPQPMWVYDKATLKILAINLAAVGHYGFSKAELASTTVAHLYPSADRDSFLKYHEQHVAAPGGRPMGRAGVWRLRKKDGVIVHADMTWNTIPFLGIDGVLVLANDISERISAQRALEESEHKLRQIIDLVPHFIFVKNRDGEYLLANTTVAAALGTTIPELLHHTDFDFQRSAEEAARDREDDLYVIDNRLSRVIPEQRFTDLNGNVRILQSVKLPFVVAGEDTPAVLGMAIDVTDRIRSAEKIAEQAALLDIATDAIIERDMTDTITFWNRGAETMYGWKKAEAEGQRVRELLFTYNGAQFDEAISALATRDAWSAELHQTTKDGRNIVVQSRWTTVHNQFGKPKSTLILNTDITEKKKFEAQFLRAQRMESIGTLASGIAHDLNNVLAPIMLTLQTLRRKLPDERSRKLLNSVEVSARRGAEMVQQVLTFARGADGERILLQPNHLVSEIEKIVRETFVRSIRIRLRSGDELWNVRGDATQLHQVLMNLCVNARDAMPGGGTLEIDTENVAVDGAFARLHVDARAGEYVRISVSDTGAGIPEEIIGKIFEPFFTTKEIGRGTGLGLSTVVAIVRSHEGFMSVYSEVGKGTTFRIYLPAVMSGHEDEQRREGDDELPFGDGELVLIADDEVSICEITKETLEGFGYRAVIASDGEEAIRIYNQRKGEIDVILTDMMMPSLDGPSLIRELRKIDTKVRIIGASGLVAADKLSDAAPDGMQAFLQKPFTADKLLRTLRAVLDSRPA